MEQIDATVAEPRGLLCERSSIGASSAFITVSPQPSLPLVNQSFVAPRAGEIWPTVYDCLTLCLARPGPYREHDPTVMNGTEASRSGRVFHFSRSASCQRRRPAEDRKGGRVVVVMRWSVRWA